jgi:hypothetical protein
MMIASKTFLIFMLLSPKSLIRNAMASKNKDNPNQVRGQSDFDVTRFQCKQIQEFHCGDRPTDQLTNVPAKTPTNEESYRDACSRLQKAKILVSYDEDVLNIL